MWENFLSMLSGAGSNAMNWIQQNPNNFASGAYQLAAAIPGADPGIRAGANMGAQLTNSAIANKAAQQQDQRIQQFLSQLAGGVTAPGMTGGDGFTVKRGKDGEWQVSSKTSIYPQDSSTSGIGSALAGP